VTFQDVATRVFSLYREADYRSALAVAQDARLSHPEEDNTLTFWEACLLARLGRKQEAMETLLAGIERGEWWPTGKLIDHDLDSVRDEPGWETVHAHCLAMTQSLLDERPRPMVRKGTGSGTLVTIQGAHAMQEDLFTTWQQATPERWTVITPVASEPTGDGGWEWPHSLDVSVRSLTSDLRGFDLSPPLVLAGFSIGSAIACHMINSTAQGADGLVAIAPSATGEFGELLEATYSVRSLVVCGDQDSRVDRYRHLESQLANREQVDFELVEGLGHANPPDLDRRVAQFLANF
jgi:predicted alpha/beta hydrolase family esterase